MYDIASNLEKICSSVLYSSVTPVWAIAFSGFLVAISLSLSAYLIHEHLMAYKNPEEQKFLVGVVLMVPCYAIESYVSLLYPSISVDCEILRDGYEAFAMYCFGRYLVACLGGEVRTIEFMKAEGFSSSVDHPLLSNISGKGIVNHPFPMNYMLKPWKLGEEFYQSIKFGIVQYMIIKSFSAVLAVFLEAFGSYCEGEFNFSCGYIYMAIALNFSQTWALYCLVQFYTVIKDELAHIKPLPKFLVFKSIVFLTWWQGVAIAIFYSLDLFKSAMAQDLHFKSSVQNFIICIEMSIASVIHLYVFPANPYARMGDRYVGDISVLGDYASVDCPLDPEEVRDSERPTKLKLPQSSVDYRSEGGMTIRESVRDVVLGSGEYIVKDVKFTVNHAEKGISRFNNKLIKISQTMKKHNKDKKRVKDDNSIESPRVIRGIDDPLLNGSYSDSVIASKGRRRRHRSGYTSAGSGGESSDQGHVGGGFAIRGDRWITRD